MLEDGEYEVIVVDASADGPALHLDLTVLTGPHKGEVVSLRAEQLGVDELTALGMPGTLTVVDGAPRVALDRV
jgi:hypothetical protein